MIALVPDKTPKSVNYRHFKHLCTVCGKEFPKDQLRAKQVSFAELGRGGKIIKRRTVAWLCPKDLAQDPAWQQERTTGSPIRRQELENEEKEK